MTISQYGGANPAANGVPGLFVQVQAPPSAPLTGAPADILGIVGTASWGPVNSPVPVSDEAGAAAVFGPMVARKFDMLTQVHAATMQGARSLRLSRQTDGTDTAAAVVIGTNGITLTSRYTGTRGAQIRAIISPGTAPGTKKVTVSLSGLQPETFDNIAGAANALWVAMAAAINSGNASSRGRSEIVVATAGASTSAPVDGTYALTGGSDGAGVNATQMIGSDTAPRTGMYALRNTGMAAFLLADVDDSTTWSTQQAFAISESALAYCVGPSGDTISNFVSVMNTAGIDNPWLKVIFGDWVYMIDSVNNVTRLVSPQGFLAGIKMVLGPHNSSLNKPLNGVVGTQKSYANQFYSQAELEVLASARAELLSMVSPGGNYPSARFGRTASSDKARNQETYTTMTNYLARSLDQSAGLGGFIGRLISAEEMREAAATISSFLQNEWDADRIGNAQGTLPYSVQIDGSNNPQSSVVLGIQKARVLVQYLSVLEYFLVDFTGGATVQIESNLPLAA